TLRPPETKQHSCSTTSGEGSQRLDTTNTTNQGQVFPRSLESAVPLGGVSLLFEAEVDVLL
ncbi:hypothetical protein, partial [Corynebacterium guaraldiae]|uniref:hypothetical protein n=1 Tax=Corynebacterium guaraldiae TaxID=3051103 RepID=UPI001E300E43